MAHLPLETWIRFLVWCTFGCLVYFGYSYQHSTVGIQQRKIRKLKKLRTDA